MLLSKIGYREEHTRRSDDRNEDNDSRRARPFPKAGHGVFLRSLDHSIGVPSDRWELLIRRTQASLQSRNLFALELLDPCQFLAGKLLRAKQLIELSVHRDITPPVVILARLLTIENHLCQRDGHNR